MKRSYLLCVAQVPVVRFPLGEVRVVNDPDAIEIVPVVNVLVAIEIVPDVNDPVSLATRGVVVGRTVLGGPFSSIHAEAFSAWKIDMC